MGKRVQKTQESLSERLFPSLVGKKDSFRQDTQTHFNIIE